MELVGELPLELVTVFGATLELVLGWGLELHPVRGLVSGWGHRGRGVGSTDCLAAAEIQSVATQE